MISKLKLTVPFSATIRHVFFSKQIQRQIVGFDFRLLHTRKRITNEPEISPLEEICKTDVSLKLLESQFPMPRATLNNVMATVDRELKSTSHNLNVSFRSVGKKGVQSWSCNCNLFWPSAITFSAVSTTKQEAARIASLKALQWLMLQGKIKNNKPVILNTAALKHLQQTNVEMKLTEADAAGVEKLLKDYKEVVVPVIENTIENETEPTMHMEGPINQFSASQIIRMTIARNNVLFRRAKSELRGDLKEIYTQRQRLPISKFRDDILQAVKDHQVLVIKGEPGCGKSTQVPQFILEEAALSGEACKCNVLVTQPRRISAISLAERVTQERGEQIGDVVGYHVRFSAKHPRPPGGSIRFCSSGILLRMIQNDPQLSNVSHIILDEAHERDVNTDMLMLLLKRLLANSPEKKLIVMSATINPELFVNYYPGCHSFDIPGFTYPVTSYFLEDINQVRLTLTRKSEEDKNPRIFHEEIADLIQWIHQNKPPGAVLVFLPGWQEIKSLLNELEETMDHHTTCILPLHSRLTLDDQHKVFTPMSPGVRKIILSTNVAETSVTIDDVAYVVDTGLQKEERLSSDQAMSVLDTDWISQANVRQRRGRAGRVRSGECFHLYSRRKHNEFPLFPTPELHRIPLQKVVLDLKTYNENEKAAEFLVEMPEPPSAASVYNAVNDLVSLGALSEDESLTILGKRIARFTTDPKLSKALVYSSIFRCLNSMLTITSILSANVDMFTNSLDEKTEAVNVKKKFDEHSDHIAMLRIFEKWNKIFADREPEEEELFCIRHMLRKNTMRLLRRLRHLSLQQLIESNMVPSDISWEMLEEGEPDVSNDLLKTILLAGSTSFLFRRNWDTKNGRVKLGSPSLVLENGKKATLSSDCLCHRQPTLPSPFLAYFRSQESVVRRTTIIRDASPISPIALFLFSSMPEIFVDPDTGKYKRRPYRLLITSRDEDLLMDLRKVIEDLVNYFLKKGFAEGDEEHDLVSNFRDQLIALLSEIVSKSSYTIHYNNDLQKER